MVVDKSLSIVIPCYNESQNLEKLIRNIQHNLKNIDFKVEVILINNGSTDDTKNKLFNLVQLDNKIKIINIEKNIGYGHGILTGLSKAKNNFLCWTHADLQCDFNDCLRGFEILYKKYLIYDNKVLLKGKRLKRNYLDVIFTKLMSNYIRLVCRIKLEDINAQPKIFHRSIYKHFKNPPHDFLLDFYLMKICKEKKFEILNLDVFFLDRKYGEAKGGGSLLGKIRLSLRTAYYIIKYNYGNNNS